MSTVTRATADQHTPCDVDEHLEVAMRRSAPVDLRGRRVDSGAISSLIRRRALSGRGRIRLANGVICGQLDLRDADLDLAVEFERCRFDAAPDLTGVKVIELSLARCRLPGLTAAGMEVERGLRCSGGFVTGPLDLRGARLGGFRADAGITFAHAEPGGRAIDGRHLTTDRDLRLHDLVCRGTLSLEDVTVGGHLHVQNLTCRESSMGSLNLSGARCERTITISSSNLVGPILLRYATIGGRLTLDNGSAGRASGPGRRTRHGSGDDPDQNLVIDLSESEFGRSVILDPAVVGDIRLVDVRVRDSLVIRAGVEAATEDQPATGGSEPQAWTVDLQRSRVETLDLRGTPVPGLNVDARDVCVTNWGFDLDWVRPDDVRWKIAAMRYTAINPRGGHHAEPWPLRDRLGWLRQSCEGNDADPYAEMAGLLRRNGDDQAARSVLVAAENSRRPTSRRGHVVKQLRRLTVGYGYRPFQLAVLYSILFALLIGGQMLPGSDRWMVTSEAGVTRSAGEPCPEASPCFQDAVFAIDTLTPAFDLGHQDRWRVEGDHVLADAYAVLVSTSVVLSWLIGALLLGVLSARAVRSSSQTE